MADHLTVDQIAELREAFMLFDRDGDGVITIAELTDILRSVGQPVTQESVQKMVSQADLDSNGVIDFPEFLTIVAERITSEEATEHEFLETFKFYDLSKNGYITASNLQFAMGRMGCKLTPEEADAMIREADLDCDGKLDFREFRRLMLPPH